MRNGLVVNRPLPGQVPTLALPIPDESLVSLHCLLSPELREWFELDDADMHSTSSGVTICGHRFVIIGWVEHCLLLRHTCG